MSKPTLPAGRLMTASPPPPVRRSSSVHPPAATVANTVDGETPPSSQPVVTTSAGPPAIWYSQVSAGRPPASAAAGGGGSGCGLGPAPTAQVAPLTRHLRARTFVVWPPGSRPVSPAATGVVTAVGLNHHRGGVSRTAFRRRMAECLQPEVGNGWTGRHWPLHCRRVEFGSKTSQQRWYNCPPVSVATHQRGHRTPCPDERRRTAAGHARPLAPPRVPVATKIMAHPSLSRPTSRVVHGVRGCEFA